MTIFSTKSIRRVLNLPKWSELHPEGRYIFYEGNDPAAFVKEIKERFGFDPR